MNCRSCEFGKLTMENVHKGIYLKTILDYGDVYLENFELVLYPLET